ncbi:MAG: Bor family protein [Gallionella sp.]
MKIKRSVPILLILLLVGCSTVTIQPQQSGKLVTQPTYEESKNFFFWGLAGEFRFDVTKICSGKKVTQMQTQQTFVNGLLGLVTLGIYSPHTVKVWCS